MKQIKTYNDPFKINDDQIDFYNKNGYLLLKNVWPKEDVDLIRLDMDNHANGHFTNKLDAHYHKNIKNYYSSTTNYYSTTSNYY